MCLHLWLFLWRNGPIWKIKKLTKNSLPRAMATYSSSTYLSISFFSSENTLQSSFLGSPSAFSFITSTFLYIQGLSRKDSTISYSLKNIFLRAILSSSPSKYSLWNCTHFYFSKLSVRSSLLGFANSCLFYFIHILKLSFSYIQDLFRKDQWYKTANLGHWGLSPLQTTFLGWVLWHIKHCRLFSAKSSLYM